MSSQPKPDFIASAPVLLVQDMKASLQFYQEQLEFELFWLAKPEEDYAIIGRNEASLHLAQAKAGEKQPSLQNLSTCQPADVNFEIRSADELWAEYTGRGVKDLAYPPTNREYGVRDFSVNDPDGYLIRFNEVMFSAH